MPSDICRKGLEMKLKIVFLLVTTLILQGCVLTKIASVPMRLGGAVVSIVPGVGNSAHDAIDAAADGVDDIPI
ncbi:MAG: hypothetical protein Q7T96_18895 [Methylobacter sp.]|nr:hypothetical protein [Methylobacter sp.]